MKKSLLALFCLSATISFSQIHEPTTSPGSSQDASKTIIGNYVSSISYDGLLLINTRNGNSTSTNGNLELNYGYSNNGSAPGSPYVAPSLSVIKANWWNPTEVQSGAWKTVFDLKADGNLFLGTTSGSSKLNIGGSIELPGLRDVLISNSSGSIGWKANTTLSTVQNFSIIYLGDATNPSKNLISFKPNGGINIGGYLNPDINLAIGSDFIPDSKVHIKTWAPTTEQVDPGNIYGLIVENTGWRAHDFAFEVKSIHGPVFSVGNSGHVLIGIQGNEGESGEINKELPDLEKYSLYVARGIRTESIRVDIAPENGWADYVFNEGYKMLPLKEIEAYIEKYGHLPGVPSAAEVQEDGIDLAEMNKILLEKIEELTIRIIELDKEVKELK